MTGVGAVFNAAKVKRGATVAVIGCGGIGLSAVNGAALAGADAGTRHKENRPSAVSPDGRLGDLARHGRARPSHDGALRNPRVEPAGGEDFPRLA